MADEIILSNGVSEVKLSPAGAELTAIKKYGEDLLWIGDPEVWKFHAPLLFPICGIVKDGKYTYEGEVYQLGNHGYARFEQFETESCTGTKAVLLHRSNDETMKVYPFEYELRVIYELEASTLKISYDVKNLGGEKMYFSIGSHEGYYCPDGIEDFSILFETPEDLDYTVYSGGLLERFTENMGRGITELALNNECFARNPKTFLNLKSKKFSLLNRKTSRVITLKIDDSFSSFTLWSTPENKFICMEPWCGVPDFTDTDSDLGHKDGIMCIDGYEQKTIVHEISF